MTDNTSIVVCGRKFDIGARVVLWDEPHGCNAYDTAPYAVTRHDRRSGTEKRVVLVKGRRYSKRTVILKPSFEKLQRIVKQFFLHHSGLYCSRDTFNVLHNQRGLSVHFILDDDGTLYQTLDLREKAWHGGGCNPMSVGIEIDSRADARKRPYAYDAAHQRKYGVGPRRIVSDIINGHRYLGFDYNDAQYATLIRLGMVLLEVFPLIRPIFPVNASGQLVKSTLAKPKNHRGLICHYHASRSKWDPVAFDYGRFLRGMREKNPDASSVRPDEKPSEGELATWSSRQEGLARLGYDPGPIDGMPGSRTYAALRRFQRDQGLVPDGVWGPKSNGAMRRALQALEG